MISSCSKGAASASNRSGTHVKIVWAQVIARLCMRWILENNKRVVLISHGICAVLPSSTLTCTGRSLERSSIVAVQLKLVEIISTHRKGQERAALRQRRHTWVTASHGGGGR